ncbi:MAG: peptidoglycan DD-metalloendopeptidase family protein [Janthinobacterium lividum]
MQLAFLSFARRRAAPAVLAAALLAGCGTAPVGPGFYRVQRGDTLSSIARSKRQSLGDLARWNGLSNPNSISTGQVLRVTPPRGSAASGAANATRTQNASAARRAPSATSSSNASNAPRAPSTSDAASDAGRPIPAPPFKLLRPASGAVLRGYDGQRSKGIDIAGNAGDPVVAAAAGTVVYAGNGLRGYGNLLIIKHQGGFLTAYAHNRQLAVKEGDSVRAGQQIAEMGDTQAERVMLHFELRYQGKPVNPTAYLSNP